MSTNTTETNSREQTVALAFTSAFGDNVKVAFTKKNRLKLNVTRENLVDVATFARDKMFFDHCTNVTGTDYPKEKQLEITYHFGSIDGEGMRSLILAISCRTPSEDPKIPTLHILYPSADYHERETAEMLGIEFTGHPNLGRFMLPEDWNDIPPMLKAYRLPGRLEEE